MAGLKLSICLLNTKTGFTTPWHCSVAQLADGEWVSAPMGEFAKDEKMEVVVEDGRPMYFREKRLSHDEFGSIRTATMNYMQEAKQISMSGYLSSVSTSRTVSPVIPSSKDFTTFSPGKMPRVAEKVRQRRIARRIWPRQIFCLILLTSKKFLSKRRRVRDRTVHTADGSFLRSWTA